MKTALTSTDDAARRVVWVGRGSETSDGAGVKLTRVIGTRDLPDLDPFLLMDEFGSDDPGAYLGGFPNHPHRGFETVTYMLAGRMRHRDSRGNEGLLEPGSVQWMTAARGLTHSEMPEQTDGLMRGFQLWVNLPAADKMGDPGYQDMAPDTLPTFEAPGVRGKVIAGSLGGVTSPVRTGATQPLYVDLRLEPSATYEADMAPEHNAFVYVYGGSATVGGAKTASDSKTISAGQIGILSLGSTLHLAAQADPVRLLLIAGKPIREAVAKAGPFVMNTRAELEQAFADHRAGLF